MLASCQGWVGACTSVAGLSVAAAAEQQAECPAWSEVDARGGSDLQGRCGFLQLCYINRFRYRFSVSKPQENEGLRTRERALEKLVACRDEQLQVGGRVHFFGFRRFCARFFPLFMLAVVSDEQRRVWVGGRTFSVSVRFFCRF